MAMASSSRLPEIIFSPAPASEPVVLRHEELNTTFTGVSHALSTVGQPIAQFRGIQYATIPARFQHSKLRSSYPEHTDAISHGPVCPQTTPVIAGPGPDGEAPEDPLPQDELDCLNLIITCPSPSASPSADTVSNHPVMVWIHGGEHTGAGSHWLYDAGAIVDKSLASHQPVVVVNINFRLGIFGNAAGPALRSSPGEAVGNYGLADQRTALEWIHRNIAAFGGDKNNVTLFGEGTGAADVLHHVHACHEHEPTLFQRAIAQSPLGAPEADVASLYNAGYQLNRIASSVGGIAGLRTLSVDELAKLSSRYPVRAVDDPSFFPSGWRARLADPSASRVPVILGESSFAAQPWAPKAAEWDATSVSKRINAVAQSKKHAGGLVRAYELAPPAILPEELPERVCDLLHDTRFAWPVESSARRLSSAGARVYRYLWDQEARGENNDTTIPHDVAYLFDTVPAPQDVGDSPFDIAVFDDADDEELAASLTLILTAQSSRSNSSSGSFSLWDAPPPVDRWSFAHVRDTLLSKWLAFAHGCAPWDQDGVFVFGPEGECGVRPRTVLQSRRRVKLWEEALAGMEMGIVQKLGVELANGPCW